MPEPSDRPTPPPILAAEPKAAILLVDDHPANLLSLRVLLEPLGQTLAEARSGEEALRLAQAEEFAVVLLDVMMPGISGFETARRLRGGERSRHTPIVFLTANDIGREQLEEAYALGAVDYLVKPIIPVVLQGKVRGFVELFQEKRRARREADQFRLLVEGALDYAIFLLDAYGRVASWNPGAERIKRYRADEIIGRHFSTFYPQEAIDRGWPQHELRVAQAEGRFEDEGWRVRKDGTQFWANVVITALKDETGNLRGYSKITRDMTERKRAEEDARRLVEESTARRVAEENARVIQEQRERLHVTLASIGDAVISTDAEGRINFLNPVAQHLVGWSTEEAATQALQDVFRIVNEDTRQPVENPAVQALRDGRVVGLANHTVLIARDGRECPIDDSAAPIRDADGRVIGSVLVFRDISDRKQVQEALRESEARFRGLMEQAPFSVQVFTPDGRTARVNRAWEDLWGVTLDQVADYNVLEDPQLDAKGILPYLKRAFAGEPVAIPAIEYDPNETIPDRTRHRDARRWVSAVAYPLKDEAGTILEIVLVHEDITARRRAEEERAASEGRFRQLADAMPQIVWSARPDGTIDYMNRQWSAFTGLPATVGNDGWDRVLHPDDAPAAHERWAASVRTGSPFEMELRLLDRHRSEYRWHLIRTVAVPDGAGRVARWYGTSTDIHAQKRVQESARFLAEASAALAGLVDYESTLQKVTKLAVPYFADWSAVDVADNDGKLRRLAVTHDSADKVRLAHDLMRDYPPDPQAKAGVVAVFRTGKPEIMVEITDDLLTQGAKDEQHLALIRALGLKSYICVPLIVSGKPFGVLTFATAESGRGYTSADLALAEDLAHRAAVAIDNARLYQALRDTDRRKDEFLATLAHELRNPLAPIRNSLQILKMPRVDPETMALTRDMIERQVHHLVRLVDDLLDVSRVMRGKIELRRERVELAAVVARAVETAKPLIDVQGHTLDLAVPNESLLLDADPVRLTQVIGNLLTNSAKYTEANGRIWLSAHRDGDQAVLTVRDSGIGIAPDMLPHVFELFVQADHATSKAQGGLGIGLTLVKNLVELHGGTVRAHSAGLGKGAEFTVRVPLLVQRQNGPAVTDAAQGEQAAPSGNRLMVVDDNRDAAVSLAMLLQLQGHDVQVAHDGPAALALAEKFRPEMIFLDIGMPGMDGYEVARRVRKTPGVENTILAALTGWGQVEDRRRSAAAGFDHHLVKPPEPKLIEKLLADLKRPG